MPSSSESRTSADATGSGTPARSSFAAARRAASRALASPAPARNVLARGSCRFGGELVCPLLGGEGLRELLEVAAEGGLEVVGGDADTVVGDASLREVVRTDLRRAVAGADLRLTEGAFLLGPFAHLALQEPGLEDPHGLLLVLELALLVLAGHDQARWSVGDPDRRVRGVHTLAAWTAGAVHVDLEVSRVDLDLHVLGLGQDGHRRRRGVYAALALGLRHPLDPVRAPLVLEDRVGAVAAYLHGHLLETTDLGRARREGAMLEAEAVGVAGVHVVDLAREERRLVAAGPGPDLDDDVLVVVRVAVDELCPDALGEVLDPLFGAPRFGREELALLRVLGLGDQLPRVPLGLYRFEQFSRQLCSTPHARVLFGDPGVAPLVVEDVRVREFLSQRVVAAERLLGQLHYLTIQFKSPVCSWPRWARSLLPSPSRGPSSGKPSRPRPYRPRAPAWSASASAGQARREPARGRCPGGARST